MGISYNPSIVTDGLVLCLDAANSRSYPGAGTIWTDLSGNGNNGTLTNGPTFSAANGGSVVFDGTNDYINFGNILNFSYTDSFTFCSWFKRTVYSGVNNILSKQTISSPYTGYQFGFNVFDAGTNGYLGVAAIGSYPSHALGVQTSTKFNNSNWYYGVATYNGNGLNSGMKIYVNSNLEPTTNLANYSGSTSVSFSNSIDFEIGARNGTNQLFTGNIPVLYIYNRALTANEVRQNYNATKGRYL